MTSTTLLSDVVCPAATWYEKHDLSSTDMHPFVHAFTPAIDPPWETRPTSSLPPARAAVLASWPRTHLGVRQDLVSVPLQHDTPGETAQPGGVVRDWRDRRVAGGPGQDDAGLHGRRARLHRDRRQARPPSGPLADTLGFTVKNVTYGVGRARSPSWPRTNGVMLGGAGDGRPGDRHRREDGRGDPGLLRDHERARSPCRGSGPGGAHRQEAGRPRRGLGGEADHLRRHPGAARCR